MDVSRSAMSQLMRDQDSPLSSLASRDAQLLLELCLTSDAYLLTQGETYVTEILMQQYGVKTFPSLVVLDKAGKTVSLDGIEDIKQGSNKGQIIAKWTEARIK